MAAFSLYSRDGYSARLVQCSVGMTMLYRLDASAAQIAEVFGAVRGEDPWTGGHIAPNSFAPIVTGGREFVAGPRGELTKPRITPRLWGVPPPPKAGDPTRSITTVRNIDSPFWIGNLRNSEFRCLLPATAFMEWGNEIDVEGRKVPHWFAASDQPLFAFAGVWIDNEVPSFALLTCEANAALKAVGRDRMPVILPPQPEARFTWLYRDWSQAKALIQPYSSSLMRKVG